MFRKINPNMVPLLRQIKPKNIATTMPAIIVKKKLGASIKPARVTSSVRP